MERTKPKSSDRQKSVEKAEVILDSAMQEFLTHGYAATSMDRVAAVAGVSKATVYSHFQDKEGLFTALIQQMVLQKSRLLFDPKEFEAFSADPRAVLKRLLTRMLDKAECDQQMLGLIRLTIGESGRFPALAQAFVRNVEKPMIELLSQHFAACPALKLPDSEASVWVFVGTTVYFLIIQELLHGKDILPMQRDRLMDGLIDLITIPSN